MKALAKLFIFIPQKTNKKQLFVYKPKAAYTLYKYILHSIRSKMLYQDNRKPSIQFISIEADHCASDDCRSMVILRWKE